MRVLLLQPEDSLEIGPWSRERWDLIVDLGKSSTFSKERWQQQCDCRVVGIDSAPQGVEDVRRLREIVGIGLGQLIDEEGIDWWSMLSLLIELEILAVQALRGVVAEFSPSAELWVTRPGGAAALLSILLNRPIRTVPRSRFSSFAFRSWRYVGLARRFSAGQIKEIFFDKYDASYEWRARFAPAVRPCSEPVVLVPSAYLNVSRMAAQYAEILPDQPFLTVATRRSGRQFERPGNMQLRDLASYATGTSAENEVAALLEKWKKLETELSASPELRVLAKAGVLTGIPGWIRHGLPVRDAWRQVLEREPICGVLCGDDSNRYTLLPVLLAARRKIPTVDFHHGAFDGRYLRKTLPCDVYLAKNEMERDYLLRVCGLAAEKVVIAAPTAARSRPVEGKEWPRKSAAAIFFSEPYEVVGMRGVEVYRELLPPLCRLARENGRRLIVKLHPFESRSQRSSIVANVLAPEDRDLVTVVDGPLTSTLLDVAWFGITVESTSVVDCYRNGLRCFLCSWLKLWPFGYVEQYARFGVGELLQKASEIAEVPQRLETFHISPASRQAAVDPVSLKKLLTTGLAEQIPASPTFTRV